MAQVRNNMLPNEETPLLAKKQTLALMLIIICLTSSDDPDINSFWIMTKIMALISVLGLGGTIAQNCYMRRQQAALIHQAKNKPNILVEEISGYNPSECMKYLIGRSKLYAKLSANDTSKELTTNEWGILPYLIKIYLLYAKQNGNEQHSSTLIMVHERTPLLVDQKISAYKTYGSTQLSNDQHGLRAPLEN